MAGSSIYYKNASFIRARDPSIVSYNRPQEKAKLKTNLQDEFGEVTQKPQNVVEEKSGNIRVYLRIKKLQCSFDDLYGVDGITLVSNVPSGSKLLRHFKDGDVLRKSYTFTHIFTPDTSQREMFNYTVKPKILHFINGQNATLLTYGASGSGKTFTVIGTDEEPGIVPRSLEYIFKTLPKLSKDPLKKPLPCGSVISLDEKERNRERLLCRSLLHSSNTSIDRSQHLKVYRAMQQRLSNEPVAELEEYQNVSLEVWVSFAEIYNEQIYDLLQLDPPCRGQQRPRLKLGMSKGVAYIKELTSVHVTSSEEAFQILLFGLHNLNYAATQVNKHSSRSHSIFTIKLVQISDRDGEACVSYFNFCDLAGSERCKKTNNVGDRLKESNNINTSLLVLGRCISALRNLQKNSDHRLVPYRESKLTQLFQKSLSGGDDIAMIVTICPSRDMFDESQHVLNFSAIAQDISIDRKAIETKNRFSHMVEQRSSDLQVIEAYQNKIQMLEEQLEMQKNEFESTQEMNLAYLHEEYGKLIDNVKDHGTMKVAEAEEQLKIMKRMYERRIQELKAKNEVIEIDSSDDECSEAEKNKKLTQELMQAANEYADLQQRYDILEKKYLQEKEKVSHLETEVESYRQQFADTLSVNSNEDVF